MPRVYCVVTERDGETKKRPGRTVTDIEKQSYRYSAENIQEVWEFIERLRNAPEEDVIAIYEEHPHITIIGA